MTIKKGRGFYALPLSEQAGGVVKSRCSLLGSENILICSLGHGLARLVEGLCHKSVLSIKIALCKRLVSKGLGWNSSKKILPLLSYLAISIIKLLSKLFCIIFWMRESPLTVFGDKPIVVSAEEVSRRDFILNKRVDGDCVSPDVRNWKFVHDKLLSGNFLPYFKASNYPVSQDCNEVKTVMESSGMVAVCLDKGLELGNRKARSKENGGGGKALACHPSLD